MDHGRIFEIAETARAGRRLSANDLAFLRDEVPREFSLARLPKTIRHPAGFTLAGAPVRTFLRCALLIAGRKAFGPRYRGADFYQRLEADLALGVMGMHFNRGAPKGAFCCKQCTLAMLTVFDANAIHHLECRPLARDVRGLIARGEWGFAKPPNAKMMAWAAAA